MSLARTSSALARTPLPSFGATLGALLLWTCAAGGAASSEEGQAAAPAPSATAGAEAAADTTAPRDTTDDRAAKLAPADDQEGLRLYAEADPEQPGLPIAIEWPSPTAARPLHEALARAGRGEGKARLLFWGASHTASDMFTGVLRTELQRRFGDGGHGFVLPVKPWRSYRHRGIEVESSRRGWRTLRIRANSGADALDDYGLAGVAVESERAGAWGEVRTARRGPVGRTASRFEIWYLAQPGGGDFDVLLDDKKVARVRTRADRRRPGYHLVETEDAPHRLRIRVATRAPVRLFGVVVERAAPGVVVDTLGINGSRARYQLLWKDGTYREHLRRRDPDLVVLAYGTNESGDDRPLEAYEADLRRVLARIRETVPEASCLLVGPSDRPLRIEEAGGEEGESLAWQDRPRTHAVNAIQRKVALESGCGFFDLVAFQGGPLSMVEWAAMDPPLAQPDHIHFTRRGYARLGTVLLGALLEGFPSDATVASRGEGGPL